MVAFSSFTCSELNILCFVISLLNNKTTILFSLMENPQI